MAIKSGLREVQALIDRRSFLCRPAGCTAHENFRQ